MQQLNMHCTWQSAGPPGLLVWALSQFPFTLLLLVMLP